MKTKGWQKVFSFTFIQYIKTKSFIISTIATCVIVAVICVLTNVLPNFMIGTKMDDKDTEETSGPTGFEKFLGEGTVFLFDESGIITEDDRGDLSQIFGGRFAELKSDCGDKIEEIKDSEAMQVVVKVTACKTTEGAVYEYEVRSYYTRSAKSSVDQLNALMQDLVRRRVMLNAGVDPEKYEDTKISVSVMKTAAGGEGVGTMQSTIMGIIPVLVAIVLFVLIFSYGNAVAQSIAIEKTSRVMELLLTSIRPLAVVIGKVLAMGVACIMQFILIIVISVGSFAASAPFGWIGKAFDLMNKPEIKEALASAVGGSGGVAGVSTVDFELAKTMDSITKMFSVQNIIMVVVAFLMGFLVFALIAALIGASVSRMEDLSAAMGPYSIVGVLGFYLAFFPTIISGDMAAMGENTANPVQIFSFFFPISSPFALPSGILLGTLSVGMACVALLVLLAVIVLITVIVAKVYEGIVLHNGNRIKLGEMLKIAMRK